MEIAGLGRIVDAAAGRHDGVGGLTEIERRITLVATHFADMGDIVAPDAEDAAHGKSFAFTDNGDRHLLWCRNDVIHP